MEFKREFDKIKGGTMKAHTTQYGVYRGLSLALRIASSFKSQEEIIAVIAQELRKFTEE